MKNSMPPVPDRYPAARVCAALPRYRLVTSAVLALFLLAGALLLSGCEAGARRAEDPEAAEADAGPGTAGTDAAGTAGWSAEELGAVGFDVSCDDEAEEGFETGVALLHHMMYVESQAQFEAVAEQDPECGMAHWGIAMTLFQPLWPTRPSPEDLQRGWEEVQLARRAGKLSEREHMYIDAVEGFYQDPANARWPQRLDRWAVAMTKLHEAYPGDLEATTLWALSQLATAEWAADPAAQRAAAAAVLETVHEESPTQPGAIHYTIHANDVDGRADVSVDITRSYDDIAPSVPHALHMPTHIYVRLGEWDEVIAWNRRSADAALAHPAGEFVSHHYPHAIDYMAYAYLQQANDEAARAVIDELESTGPYQPTFISTFHLASTPARYYVERREWEEAAALEPRLPADLPWDGNPATEAITWFARGLGAARSGDVVGAREAEARLAALRDAEKARGEDYWATQVETQRLAVEAWAELLEGRRDIALQLMIASAELEASQEKHPVTPGALQPAYELLGDMYMELDRPADALAAYERSLQMWPRRFNSLLGAARAADAAGQGDRARLLYAEVVALAAPSSERAGVAEAREHAQSAAE